MTLNDFRKFLIEMQLLFFLLFYLCKSNSAELFTISFFLSFLMENVLIFNIK